MSSVKLNEEEKRLLHNAWHHFLTITHHKLVVMEGCFKVGLFKQGLLHDLSKYSWEEFKTGVKYYLDENRDYCVPKRSAEEIARSV